MPADEPSDFSNLTYLPPRWALGYHESYEELPAPEALVAIAQRFRNRDIPLESLQITPLSSQTDRSGTSSNGVEISTTLTDQLEAFDLKTSHEKNSTNRPFLITRARHGDTPSYAAVSFPVHLSDWNGLRHALTDTLDCSLRGFPLCGPNLYPAAVTDDAELVIRSIQLATFLPLLHVTFSHPHRSDNSVWPFSRAVANTWRRYLGLRYKLLPYLYTAFDQYRRTGTLPIRAGSRPPSSPAGKQTDAQFFAGPSLMVAPVLRKGKVDRSVNLPEDTWFHFWTNQPYGSHQTITQPAPLERIPLFARGGSVIPLHPYMCQSDDYQPTTLILRTYPRGSRTSELYLDDGATYAYREGDYRRVEMKTVEHERRFSVRIRHEGRRPLPYDHFEWQLPRQSVRRVTADGRELAEYDMPRDFAAAEEGVFDGHYFLRIRTSAHVDSVEISVTG